MSAAQEVTRVIGAYVMLSLVFSLALTGLWLVNDRHACVENGGRWTLDSTTATCHYGAVGTGVFADQP